MNELVTFSDRPVTDTLWTVSVFTGIPRAGRLDIVEFAMSAYGVLAVNLGLVIVGCGDPLPETNARVIFFAVDSDRLGHILVERSNRVSDDVFSVGACDNLAFQFES